MNLREVVYSIFLLLFLLLFLYFFSFTGFDILSINQGGNANFTLGPTGELPIPILPSIIAHPGNQTFGTIIPSNIVIKPTSFDINLAINTNIQETISITNTGTFPTIISVYQQNLNTYIILGNNSFSLAPGQTTSLNIIFVAPSTPGIYSGDLVIANQVIPVTLNVRTELLLFDSNIVVLNPNYIVPEGTPLQTQVTLTPKGDQERLDVSLNYTISNNNGTVYLTQTQTMLIQNQTIFNKNFDTGGLPLGNYTIGLELIYLNGTAPSSAHFEIVARNLTFLGFLIYYLIVGILLISIAILIVLIIRSIKDNKPKILNNTALV